jgi:RarD protein
MCLRGASVIISTRWSTWLLGVFLLKERLSAAQKAAVFLAAAGVAVLAAGAGDALWISLTLAASFALYGFLRKVAPVDSLEGLAIETTILLPIALGWVVWLQWSGTGNFLESTRTDVLLILGGAITAIPLLLFHRGGAAAALFDARASCNISRRRCSSCLRFWCSASR